LEAFFLPALQRRLRFDTGAPFAYIEIGPPHMKFGKIDHFLTGISVPVAALSSKESVGIGEFADLPLLGRWCVKAGIGLIQILPVNDTGTNSSPYSALSAYALHPLYLRLQEVRGAPPYSKEIGKFRESAATHARFPYPEVLAFKLAVARRIFDDGAAAIEKDKGFITWRDANPWVVPYAAFRTLKTAMKEAPWRRWPELSPGAIWESERAHCLFYAWLQFVLDAQLTAASRSLQEMGILLKGDIPILMSVESADVWDSTRYFDLTMTAGAPPDMYSADGQNWSFPVYNWKEHEADGYSWWKRRLREAGKFFHAFRIDHVLGFFRIWAIPDGETRATLGMFRPSLTVKRKDLEGIGFKSGGLVWLSVPHVRPAQLEALIGADAGRVLESYFDRVGHEELFTLKPGMDSERAILALDEPAPVKDALASAHMDRTLIPLASGDFQPAWYFWRSTSFKSLSADEQARLKGLFESGRHGSEELWEAEGRKLLTMLRDSTDMLVCAEDLGDVPERVPHVLADLGILGLRISRWTREYEKPDAPFIPPSHYPRLSVCTASVHDTSTLRGWWEESAAESEAYYRSLGLPGPCPSKMTRELLEKTIGHLMGTDSLICVFQLQDVLDLDRTRWSADPSEDRINVPGTINAWNWTWRMPYGLEELLSNADLTRTMASLSAARSERPL
jgi:4-alpha-glucanotransferase